MKKNTWHYFWENVFCTLALIAIMVGIILIVHALAWLCGWWAVPVIGILILLWVCWRQAEDDVEIVNLEYQNQKSKTIWHIDDLFEKYCAAYHDLCNGKIDQKQADGELLILTSALERFKQTYDESDPYYRSMAKSLKELFDINLSEL